MFIRISRRPNSSFICLTAARTLSFEVVSRVRGRNFGGVFPAFVAAAWIAVEREETSERAPTARYDIPVFAKARTVARPMPREPPMIRMAFPVRSVEEGVMKG